MEMQQIARKIFFVMKINVECQKIGKFGFEIFGGREVGVTYKGIGLGRSSRNRPGCQETNAFLSLPYQRTISGEISLPTRYAKYRGMRLFDIESNAVGYHIADFRLNSTRVQERYVLGPRNADDHSEAIGSRQVKQPFGRRREGTKAIDAESSAINAKSRSRRCRLGKGNPRAARRERAVRDSLQKKLFIISKKKPTL